jgi:hypothetical protein
MTEKDLTDYEIEQAKKQAHADEKRLKEHLLDATDKNHCQNVVVFGPQYLFSLGWKQREIEMFLQRIDVRTEIACLQAQYIDREAIQSRTQFYAQLKINSLVPRAITILARALVGTVLDQHGNIKDRPPERVQIDASMEVLNRANIQGKKFKESDKLVNLGLELFGNTDPKKTLDAPSREKLRKALGKMTARMSAADKIAAREAKTVEGSPPIRENSAKPADEVAAIEEEDSLSSQDESSDE